jgi:hypothetical protein
MVLSKTDPGLLPDTGKNIRYQAPDSVFAGWPEEVAALAKEIYPDFNK